jgi:hypothetical protein
MAFRRDARGRANPGSLSDASDLATPADQDSEQEIWPQMNKDEHG